MSLACADVKGINMAQGVCDTDVPHPVAEAAIEAIRSGHNTYTRLDGIATLRHAIADKFASFNGLNVNPATQVLVTSGATGALHAALMALLNPGDECIVLEPFYGYHVGHAAFPPCAANGCAARSAALDSGSRPSARRRNGPHAWPHSEHTLESLRQGLLAGRTRTDR